MRYLTFLSFLLVLLVTSCSHENIGRNADNVYFVGESSERLSITDCVSRIDVTPLDTAAYISEVSKGVLVGNSLFVSDDAEKSIYKFDVGDGSLSGIFSKVGHGHNEYLRLVDFDVDTTTHKVFVLCEPHKLMELSLDLQLIREVQLPDSAYQNIAVFNGNVYLASNYGHLLSVVRNDKTSKLLELPDTPAMYGLLSRKSLCLQKTKDELLLFPVPFSSIFSIKGDSVKQVIHFSYPDEDNKIERLYGWFPTDYKDRNKDEYSFPKLCYVMANDSILLITYEYGGDMRFCVVDKVTNTLLKDCKRSFSPPFPNLTCGDSFYLVMLNRPRYDGINNFPELEKIIIYSSSLNVEDDQLVLMKYYFYGDWRLIKQSDEI